MISRKVLAQGITNALMAAIAWSCTRYGVHLSIMASAEITAVASWAAGLLAGYMVRNQGAAMHYLAVGGAPADVAADVHAAIEYVVGEYAAATNTLAAVSGALSASKRPSAAPSSTASPPDDEAPVLGDVTPTLAPSVDEAGNATADSTPGWQRKAG